jgi:hypothetical protein
MKLYSCKVRLHGSVADEVRKSEVTSAEISVLQDIHGDDAVLDVAELATKALNTIQNHPRFGKPRTEDDERDRLEQTYGAARIAKVFGPRTRKMSADLSVDIEPVPRRTRITKSDPITEAAAATADRENALVD